MIKKKIGVLIAGVVVIIFLACMGAYWRNETKSLIQQVENLQGEISSLNKKQEELTHEKNELATKNEEISKNREDLLKQIEELKKEYEELNASYQKEIEPVSFNSSNITTPSNATIRKLEGVLNGTGLQGLSEYYLKAEEDYGINSIFLVALTAEESGWGSSHRARTQNNLSGFAVYSPSSEGETFGSKGESILATAKLLSENYLTEYGKYYNGLSASAVNLRYCPNDGGNWSSNITKIANELVSKINSQ